MLAICKLFIVASVFIMISKCKNIRQRVFDGRNALDDEFPYVVSFQNHRTLYRWCTGTLISSTCVLTASHCIMPVITVVRFGNMTISPNVTFFRKVLKMVKHPNYKDLQTENDLFDEMKNDIGLVFIQTLRMKTYAKISGIDYKTLIGVPVVYAGFGTTFDSYEATYDDELADQMRPLQIGEGVVISCSTIAINWTPSLCVAPKCSSNMADSAPGDSGGPLFFKNKIVAVVSGGTRPIGIYTPVSLYLDWIRLNMIAEIRRRKKNKNVY